MKLANSGGRQKPTPPPSSAAEPTKADSRARPNEMPHEQSDREERIRKSAYHRAEMHGFEGDPAEHWLAAEAEIDADKGAVRKSPSSGGSMTKETEQARMARSMGNSERK